MHIQRNRNADDRGSNRLHKTEKDSFLKKSQQEKVKEILENHLKTERKMSGPRGSNVRNYMTVTLIVAHCGSQTLTQIFF
jgi:hypothetical protein